jgi:hypothetical protein
MLHNVTYVDQIDLRQLSADCILLKNKYKYK